MSRSTVEASAWVHVLWSVRGVEEVRLLATVNLAIRVLVVLHRTGEIDMSRKPVEDARRGGLLRPCNTAWPHDHALEYVLLIAVSVLPMIRACGHRGSSSKAGSNTGSGRSSWRCSVCASHGVHSNSSRTTGRGVDGMFADPCDSRTEGSAARAQSALATVKAKPERVARSARPSNCASDTYAGVVRPAPSPQ
eukprot:scaffold196_cov371-Prasinococcus_capsulatus_cf.AAC.16